MTDGMQGRTVLVTGGTAGIGKETALGLARLGARVVIVGRNEAKTRAVVEELKSVSGNQQLDFLLGDLSSMAEVRRVAADFERRFGILHVLVNNVGGMNLSRETTVDGLERTFAMNHLSYFLLTKLLLPALERGAPSRVVVVSSDAHRGARLDWDDLQSTKRYSAFGAYGRSKLLNVLFTRELARRLEGKKITVNCLHPGMVDSDFMAKRGVIGTVGKVITGLFGLTPQQGALTSLYLASSPEVDGVTGRYFEKSKEKAPSPAAQDDAAAARLWELSEKLV